MGKTKFIGQPNIKKAKEKERRSFRMVFSTTAKR